ncbi:hypothetical protein [Kocuria rosea]|uniref:hypothetical protein n=1 Tax=Kocuria rosea TaxID=1275 RepID=UPI0020424CEC|nr:hypothetical protein [Kocuria rosea]MCM3688686.1 hypothetical protein [Kocuria rosea]
MHPAHRPGTDDAAAAFTSDPAARAAAFTALRPALNALAADAGADPGLSAEARRVMRAVTGPADTLALAALAARASTPKSRIVAALGELRAHGYLARLTAIAPHLTAALPALSPCPEGVLGGDHGDSTAPTIVASVSTMPSHATHCF